MRARLPDFKILDRSGGCMESNGRLPMLITGIAGVAGFNAFAYFRKKYGSQIIGQRPVNNWPLSSEGIIGIDLEDERATRSLLEQYKFKTVLNCGGSCALKGCELDPTMAHRVNVEGVRSLVNTIDHSRTRFVHLSIDLVYSGTRGGNHSETDLADPVTVYGSTMVKAEELIMQQIPAACILRISLPMGISFNGHAGAIDWIQSRFAAGKPATLYYDEVRTPVYVECLVETIEEVICNPMAGVFHAGGPGKLSLFQIAQIVNLTGGYAPDLLHGCYRIEAGPMPPRAGNVTMNSQKLSVALKRAPFLNWPINTGLMPDSRDWHYQRDGRPGSLEQIKSQLYFRPECPETAQHAPNGCSDC